MSEQEWEDLCDGCGLCCRLPSNRDYACPALNCGTNKCTSYKTRLYRYMCVKVTPANVADLHHCGTLPDSCGYVRYMKGKPPLDDPPVASLRPFGEAPREHKLLYQQYSDRWFRNKID